MISKSVKRFSDKIMREQKTSAAPRRNTFPRACCVRYRYA